MRPARFWAAAALTALLAVPVGDAKAGPGAAGHGHGAQSAFGRPGDPKRPYRTVEVIMREGDGRMEYVPSRIEVRQGEQIRFVMKNHGELEHEFVLATFDENAQHAKEMEKNPEMEHDEPNMKRVRPKAGADVFWRFTKAGEFQYACLIPGHMEAGMKGVVAVSPAKPAPAAKPAKTPVKQ
jgi:uncharacterized cupredoxin-like copper-binding protein